MRTLKCSDAIQPREWLWVWRDTGYRIELEHRHHMSSTQEVVYFTHVVLNNTIINSQQGTLTPEEAWVGMASALLDHDILCEALPHQTPAEKLPLPELDEG